MFSEHTSVAVALFFALYALTGAMPLFAAVYLQFRRGNAFSSDTTPPMRLRRWAASFFAVAALGHVWWLLFYIFSNDIHSVSYIAVVVLDGMTLTTTIAGTLLAMLQDRRRPVWPVIVAMIPFVALEVVHMVNPSELLMQIAFVYVVLLYVLFTVYVAFAVRQYGRWLRDNYADLERKEVWLTHVLSLLFLLLFIFYSFVDTNIILMYLLHVIELVLFCLLLWRVETLPSLNLEIGEGSEYTQGCNDSDELSAPPRFNGLYTPFGSPVIGGQKPPGERGREGEGQGGDSAFIDLEQIERLLKEHCVDKQLYLQHDLSLQQLAQAVGTNRFYLSQYFSRHGITYNTYINNLRINHFISRHEEALAVGKPVSAKQLAYESGFRSYRTFSRAFTQRTGQSVTAWMDQSAK